MQKNLTDQELKALYQSEYVQRFAEEQDENRIAQLMKYIQLDVDSDVVDFGCGNGMLLPIVAKHVRSYTGVDFSEEFITKAIQQRQNVTGIEYKFVCEDINRFCDTHEGKFHTAFVMDISEHVYDEKWLELLMSIRRSLATGGRLYLHTPNAGYVVEKMKARNFILKQFPQHIAVRNMAHNVSILQEAGFEICNSTYVPHYNILRHLHQLSRIPVIGKYLKARILIEATAQ